MHRSTSLAAFVLMMGVSPTALMAQEEDRQQSAPPQDMGEEEIVVTGQAPRGSVIGAIQPEQQFNAGDIRALGVSSVSELIAELAPQTNAAGGAPVVLLNGKRISSFSEISDLPAEAIARTEILSEEVALAYGYAPTQKVVNIVLRQRFRAESADLRGATTTDGGRESGGANLGLLRIRGDSRFTLDLKYNRAASLLESERGINPTTPGNPFSIPGNVGGLTRGAQVDPALSALAGQTVTVAAVPGIAANGAPALGDFVAGANTASISDLSRYRTLSPATESFSANATLARPIGDVSATLNGRVELSENNTLQGLSALTLNLPDGNPFSPFSNDVQLYRYLEQAGALGQRIRGTTSHIGLTLNGRITPKWQWSFTGNADLSDTRTATDRGVSGTVLQTAISGNDPTVNPFATSLPDGLLSTRLTDSARAKSQAVQGDLLISGTLFNLPAGAATTAIRLGASANGFDGESTRSGVFRSSSYNREIGSGQISLDLPLTSRGRNVLGAVGDLGVNVNAAAQRLSDFGTLSTLGYGLRWTPIPQIRFLLSANQDRAAPTGNQINDPTITTPNVSLFDYARGETVFVTQISGGNPNLRESVRDQFRLGVTLKPLEKANLTLTATYLNSRTDNPISSFPTPTPAIEAAFPQRFMRDADGTLLQIDGRPINYLSSQRSQLRWGFDYSIPIKSSIQKQMETWRASGAKREDMPADLRAMMGNRGPGGQGRSGQAGGEGQQGGGGQAGGPDGAQNADNVQRGGESNAGPGGGGERGPGGGFGGGGFRGGGGGGRGGPGGGGGRIQFSLYHTWHFTDSILIAPGVPELDLLNGDATGSSGGQPRHELQARVGYSNNGLGGRLSIDWESGTHVDGALGGTSRLNFGSLATANLRLFANLGQIPALVRDHPFFRGARVSVGIDNILNTRRNVTDATGATPLRYQPGYLDPLGRTISVSFRKLFF
ncbi:TonB-dependent receptor [Sphingobium aromaticiconvertens]|uniref:TonB-dependent receptor n=1 Tax=Sphingobium aromaticiconvertens TaxID=365341 RepID=UPI0030194317